MNKKTLNTLRSVLIERLASGEDPESLRRQLGERLKPQQVDSLMAQAVEELDASHENPRTLRSIGEVRKRRDDGRARQLPGPKHKGTRVTAQVFGAIGVFVMLGALGGARSGIPILAIGAVFLASAIALWKWNSLLGAGVIAVVCGLLSVGSTLLIFDFGLSYIVLVMFWLAMLAVAVRAFMVVRANRRHEGAVERHPVPT